MSDTVPHCATVLLLALQAALMAGTLATEEKKFYLSSAGHNHNDKFYEVTHLVTAERVGLAYCSVLCAQTQLCTSFMIEASSDCHLKRMSPIRSVWYEAASGMDVYSMKAPDVTPLGCFTQNYDWVFIFTVREGMTIIEWKPESYEEIISICAMAAKSMGYSVYGVIFFGACYSSGTAHLDYHTTPSELCVNGLGVANVAFVYSLK